MKMKLTMKLMISSMAMSALLMGGCTTQTNKPPAGTGHTGPVSDGQDGTGTGGLQNSGNGSGSGAVANNGRNNAGRGNSQGGNPGGLGSGNNQGGLGNGFGSGSGGLGSGNGYGQGNGSNNQGQGGFGSGSAYGGNTKGSYSPADLRDPRSILAQRIIYFEYDKAAIKPEYRRILDAHGSLLADFPELNVRLEGHADERGSREYNVALSERRAYSVLNYLKIKGVKTSQADIVGYGEEVPATFGHGEGSWSKNRRVEIIYAGE